MTWQEFRQWAMIHHGYRIRWVAGTGAEWRAIWGVDATGEAARTGTGSGYNAYYGPVQCRRFAFWLTARDLVADVSEWLAACEQYDDGWLVNDGSGIRWESDPDPVELVKRGFVAIKCGPCAWV